MKHYLLLTPFLLSSLFTCNNISEDNRHISTPRNKAVTYVSIKSEKDIEDEPKVAAMMKIIRNDSILLNSAIGIEFRGAVSQFENKKSYGFELRDSTGKSSEESILGMSKDEDWILHGPMSDHSFIRNALAYTLSMQMGRYATHFQYVELEVNGNYKGLYLLMEKLKRNKNRINISSLKRETTASDSITGGYILKIDKTAGTNANGWSDYNEKNSFASLYDAKGKPSKSSPIHYLYEYPKSTQINSQQKNYIKKYTADFEQVMANQAANYAEWIDVDSFVDYFILTEFMQNNDGYRISTFLQKDLNKKLAMGPIWDCDLAFGPENVFCNGMRKDAWVFKYNQYCGNDEWLIPFWWEKLLKEETFKQKVRTRWQELRKTTLSDNNVELTITKLAQYLQENKLVDRNYERWGERNSNSFQARHQKHIESIKNWSKKHSKWIDQEILNL